MPTIVEEPEMEGEFLHGDFPLLAVPSAADNHLTLDFLPADAANVADGNDNANVHDHDHDHDHAGTQFCPLHGSLVPCSCNDLLLRDWDLPDAVVPTAEGIDEPDYSRFENWIPRFVRPDKPCDYCRQRRLDCYVQRGEPHCTPCRTLFRECSLSNSNTLEATNYINQTTGNFLDTLHLIDEDATIEHGTLTGIKELKSKSAGAGSRVPLKDDAPGSSKRNGIRFPRHAIKLLRDWFESHANSPYPTEDEKLELERKTELAPRQIANWLANERRRRKATEKYRPKVAESPSLRPTTAAIPIPTPEKPWEELNPFERWKHSPPEHEPASMTDIANAVASKALPADESRSASPSTLGQSTKRRKASSSGSGWSKTRALSTASAETVQTSSISASTSAAFSNGSSHSTHGSFGSFSSGLAGKKDRRRRRRPNPLVTGGQKSNEASKRIFQCTFCTDTFKSKYDWTRHEKSLHLSLEKWICAPTGPVKSDPETGDKQCVYCGLHNPSSDHIESHNHKQCEEKGIDARTFYRKDHLRQHLRLMHGCEMTSSMDSWKSVAVNINSRCGFCTQRFTVWQERSDHLTAHFKAGAKMTDWKGCRGLDPAVAAQVTNAMPPYLIGMEAVSPQPFSASNRSGLRYTDQYADLIYSDETTTYALQEGGSNQTATCWEILTVRLAEYAKQQAALGIVMTDEMLQRQAREILYDSEDPWNQTAADHPEWLDLFKKAHGLNFIPNQIGGQGSEMPEDIETFSDLGLRIPFAIQLQAYNQAHAGSAEADRATTLAPHRRSKALLRNIYELLSEESALYYGDQQCHHAACAANVLEVEPELKLLDKDAVSGPWTRRWCCEKISADAAQQVEEATAACSVRGNPASGSVGKARQSNHTAMISARGSREVQNHSFGKHTSHGSELANDQQQQAFSAGLPITDAYEASRSSQVVSATVLKSNYLPRHKLELPRDKARLFATTTGAWADPRSMPPIIATSPPSIANPHKTSTGAMMEFLGGDIGASLPFSADARTSDIHLNEDDWQLPPSDIADSLSQREMVGVVHALTASAPLENANSFLDQSDPSAYVMDWTGEEPERLGALPSCGNSSGIARATPQQQQAPQSHSTVTVGDLDVNLTKLDFDAIFDMPLDETFGLEA